MYKNDIKRPVNVHYKPVVYKLGSECTLRHETIRCSGYHRDR